MHRRIFSRTTIAYCSTDDGRKKMLAGNKSNNKKEKDQEGEGKGN